ncbi:MAG: 30S ribosomal protein S20 [bacterium]|nr:30S ribosomal protein S20 [bacterium]
MPNSLGAKKRLRQNVTRRDQNRSYRSAMRTQIKKVREAIEAGDIEKAQSEFKLACVSLDRAASRNIIHDNKAARTKSRLSKAIRVAGESAK